MRALSVISRSFARRSTWLRGTCNGDLHIDRGKFPKSFNDRGEIISNLGYSTSFPRNQKNSVEIAYISYKNLPYTLDKSAKKIDGRVMVLSPHVKAWNFVGLVECFFYF